MKINKHRFNVTLFSLLLISLMLAVAPSAWSTTADARHQNLGASKHQHHAKKPRHKKSQKQPAPSSQPSEGNETSAPAKIIHTHQLSALDETLNAAYLTLQQADFNGARQHYRQALALDSNSRDALLGLAVVAQHEGQDAAALHFFQAAWQLDPADPVANAGLALFARSDGDATESRLKQLLAQTASAPLHFALGNHYAAQSRWADARLAYGHALSLEPNNALLNLSVAVSLDHLQQTELAQHYYQQAMQLSAAQNGGFDRVKIQRRLEKLTAQ